MAARSWARDVDALATTGATTSTRFSSEQWEESCGGHYASWSDRPAKCQAAPSKSPFSSPPAQKSRPRTPPPAKAKAKTKAAPDFNVSNDWGWICPCGVVCEACLKNRTVTCKVLRATHWVCLTCSEPNKVTRFTCLGCLGARTAQDQILRNVQQTARESKGPLPLTVCHILTSEAVPIAPGCKGGPHAALGLAGGACEADGGGLALDAEAPNAVPVGKLDGRVPEEEEEAHVGNRRRFGYSTEVNLARSQGPRRPKHLERVGPLLSFEAQPPCLTGKRPDDDPAVLHRSARG